MPAAIWESSSPCAPSAAPCATPCSRQDASRRRLCAPALGCGARAVQVFTVGEGSRRPTALDKRLRNVLRIDACGAAAQGAVTLAVRPRLVGRDQGPRAHVHRRRPRRCRRRLRPSWGSSAAVALPTKSRCGGKSCPAGGPRSSGESANYLLGEGVVGGLTHTARHDAVEEMLGGSELGTATTEGEGTCTHERAALEHTAKKNEAHETSEKQHVSSLCAQSWGAALSSAEPATVQRRGRPQLSRQLGRGAYVPTAA